MKACPPILNNPTGFSSQDNQAPFLATWPHSAYSQLPLFQPHWPLSCSSNQGTTLRGRMGKNICSCFTQEETEAQRGYFAQVMRLLSVAQIFLAPDPVLFLLQLAFGIHVS